MNPKDFVAFISNGKELTLAGVRDVVDLESHDQAIQADECNCTHKEYIASCDIVKMCFVEADTCIMIYRGYLPRSIDVLYEAITRNKICNIGY